MTQCGFLFMPAPRKSLKFHIKVFCHSSSQNSTKYGNVFRAFRAS
jgi:hypothetical protein